QRWPHRIGHTHLKDVRSDIAEEVRTGQLGYAEAVKEGMYVPLGDGDVDIEAVLQTMHRVGYDGWYVLEQDTALAENDPGLRGRRDTARSLAYLRRISLCAKEPVGSDAVTTG
ncbi:sugar phosphate isomerase/epimerase family protein, partial [Longimycelium tulufanense]|uniref:sugar phosphate isomerase/epimerase family protein n=1 Tax=Longimycelium tulufanense TaxID=907463 RepID=UPI001E283830